MSTSNNSRKRKHPNPTKKPSTTVPNRQNPDPALFIQAYEATIIRGPHAKAAARSLEVVQYDFESESDDPPPSENQKKGQTRPVVGEALIRWGGSRPTIAAFPSDEDEDCLIHDGVDSRVLPPEEPAFWVDR